MGREEQIIKERLKKIEELRKQGIEPYAYAFNQKDKAAELHAKFSELRPEEKSGYKASIAGRVMAVRDIGKIIFAVLQDASGKIQVVLQKDETSSQMLEFFKRYIDTGDIIGVRGEVIRTKRGELSVLAKKVEILAKAIRPLPEKWHGLQDKEERYRKRYLDLIMNPEVKDVFIKRTKIIDAIREFLNARGFLEVETPILQSVYGGAAARPFVTHLNALNMKLYLRISNELYLKRLLIAGLERVYEFSKDFRNEGIDRLHNPEFLQIEIYQAYATYEDMIQLFTELVQYVAKKVLGTTKIQYQGQKLDLSKWEKLTMRDAIKKYVGIDVEAMDDKELKKFMKEKGIEAKHESRGWLISAIFEELVEPKLIKPTIIMDYPAETTPLCKEKQEQESKTRLIERFEPFVAGIELGNAYSELNDPVKQRKLFEEQAGMLRKGDEEAHPYDKDFVEAVEYGMPPAGGLGIGIDRLVMLLTNSASIRDVLLFPFMRPKEESGKGLRDKDRKRDKQS